LLQYTGAQTFSKKLFLTIKIVRAANEFGSSAKEALFLFRKIMSIIELDIANGHIIHINDIKPVWAFSCHAQS